MKKYIGTSERFTGEIAVDYAADGSLTAIQLLGTDLKPHQTAIVFKNMPIVSETVEQLSQAFANIPIRFVKEDVVFGFDVFWEKYDKKINKARAEKIWNKMNAIERIKAFAGIYAYDRFLQRNTWRSKAYPETYLKQKYWENDWSKVKS